MLEAMNTVNSILMIGRITDPVTLLGRREMPLRIIANLNIERTVL